ncbi:nitrogen fixation protein NifZ [Parasulfuritortus cantonensis]|uniref:Nitrogen fixation protein NifZ n=1 Tax=Parasulfuritortus cantonensis TaxID=2528202 RepID=A0A4V2NV12_9PROT|nr:nitrogen fixation protein NifZ [Parasulfuritortus cantonensis]TCJ11686.1 nitrogen fixation protein NifZ [Parasulfuritortus cantonensis]
MSRFEMGDLVYSALDIYNDPVEETGESGIPGLNPGDLLAAAGARGVVVNIGHAEAMPDEDIYLVRFETGAAGGLGDPIGCLAEELSHEPAA